MVIKHSLFVSEIKYNKDVKKYVGITSQRKTGLYFVPLINRRGIRRPVKPGLRSMKERAAYLSLVLLSLPTSGSTQTSRVCTFPSVSCYDGSVRETELGTKYLSFQGIRFAQPPTGELRFQLPEKYEAEQEVYDVSGTSDIKCVQFGWDGENVEGTEDCLFLNVYVPG